MRLRRVHQLLGLVIFLPAFLWGLSGAFLAWKNWDREASPKKRRAQPVVQRPFRIELDQAMDQALAQARSDAATATEKSPGSQPRSIEWRHLAETPYFVIAYKGAPQPVLINGETGERLPRITPEIATHIAAAAAPEDLRVTGCALQTEPSLVYLDGMELPVYRVSMSDGSNAYVSPTTGEQYFRAPRVAFLIRFAYYGLHVFKWTNGPRSHHAYLVLLLLGLLQCGSSVTGLWLWLGMRRASRRRTIS